MPHDILRGIMSLFAVGSYTESAPHVPDARGEGIYLIRLEHDRLQLVSTLRDIRNPSYLSWDPDHALLYCVAENPDGSGAVSLFRFKDRRFERLSTATEPGRAACHILHLPEKQLVAVSSYRDGRLSLYKALNASLGPALAEHRYSGSGADPGRQASPHAHQAAATPDGAGILVCDLGSDTVWYHALDDLAAPPTSTLTVPAGYGPRHMALDPDGRHGYLLCELKPELLLLQFAPDWRSAAILDELDTVPPEERDKAAPAAVKLHPSGRSLAVSNRFTDTIALYTIEHPGSGPPRLRPAASFPSGGKTPRDIEFSSDGRLLIVANQDSNRLASQRFDPESGLPLGAGPELELGTPVCLVGLE